MPPAGTTRGATKRDVELAKHQVELAKVNRSMHLWTIFIRGVVVAMWIAAVTLPLWVFQGIVEPLAGKETIVNANIVISISLTLSIAINIAQAVKGASQKAELQRQRGTISELERNTGA